MKKLIVISIVLFAMAFITGCPEDNSPVSRGDVTVHLQTVDSDSGTNPVATPEPTTLVLLGSGLVGLGIIARKRLKK